MNITPSYPNIIPIALQPQTESARRDNGLRERIPAPAQGEPFARESQIGSDKDKARASEGRQTGYQTSEPGSRQGDGSLAVAERQGRGQQQGGQEGNNKDKGSDSQSRQQQALLKEVEALKSRDQEVRVHEQAHRAVGGQYASAATFTMRKGPDGKEYAVGGEVQIDISPISGEPAATITKMQQVRSAALAPAQPSGQDRSVAARASQLEAEARSELASIQAAKLSSLGKSDPSGNEPSTSIADSGGSASLTGSAALQSADTATATATASEATMQQRASIISQRYDNAWRPADGASVSSYA